MFCPRCNKLITKGAHFCPSCGAPVDSHTKAKANCGSTEVDNELQPRPAPKQNTPTISAKKKSPAKIIVASVLALCIIAGVSIYGYALYKETSYKNAVSDAESAFANSDYNGAIGYLNKAIELKPEVPGNYLMLATAFVEKNDICSASEVLQSGYAVTSDKTLDDVSIWGPMLGFETALWLEEADIPFTRQEYHFSNHRIIGTLNAFGRVVFANEYFFDEAGYLAHTTLSDYSGYVFGGGANAILDAGNGYSFHGEADMALDYSCDENGRVTSVSYDGETVAVLDYTEADVVKVCIGEDETQIHYGSNGKVEQINSSYSGNYEFQYDSAGDCSVVLPGDFGCMKFSDCGLLVGFDSDDADAISIELNDDGKILSVSGDEGIKLYSFIYTDDGLLKEATRENYTVRCTYDAMGDLIRLDYSDNTYRDIVYDENGNISKMVQNSPDSSNAWEVVYSFTEDQRISTYAVSNEYGVYICKPTYSDYGGLIDCSYSEATYNPGTYSGVAAGWFDNIVVSVTVDYENILSISVDSQNETAGVGTKAFEPLTEDIIVANSTDVDAISGATTTSDGFKAAVADALDKAIIG